MAFRILLTSVFVFLLSQGFCRQARAEDPMREFLLSCAYGAMAGGLVGTATLILAEDPEGNYRNIAKGVSVGLYAGILLGTYRVLSTGRTTPPQSSYGATEPEVPQLALLPQWQPDDSESLKLDGLAVHWLALKF